MEENKETTNESQIGHLAMWIDDSALIGDSGIPHENVIQTNGHVSDSLIDSGTEEGSAGDPARCNAQKVLKIEIDGVEYYIPIFDRNA